MLRVLVEDVVDSAPQRRHRYGSRAVEEEMQLQRIRRGEDASATVAHVPFATFHQISLLVYISLNQFKSCLIGHDHALLDQRYIGWKSRSGIIWGFVVSKFCDPFFIFCL